MRWWREGILLVLGGIALLGCLGLRRPPEADVPVTRRVVTQRFGAITIHALHTGWVRVKAAHRDLAGPVGSRMLSILLGRAWTPWMPVIAYAIQHPDGVFLVDPGLTERLLDREYFACDPGTAFVYRNLLQFRHEAADRIDRQLAALGIDLTRLRGVVLTHRHADHADGLDLLPASAPVYVGQADWPTHSGAISCRWPSDRAPTLIGEGAEVFGALRSVRRLTTDGRVRIVPLAGHSPGHLGVLVELGEEYALIAGDAVFDLEQVRARRLAGIVEHPAAARATLDAIAAQLRHAPTYLLPAHDPESLERYARRMTTPDCSR